jgi:hypothetical protein
MVDVEYARGWGDCLEVIETILSNVKTVNEAKTKVKKLQELVKDKKFEKIKYELGIFGIF